MLAAVSLLDGVQSALNARGHDAEVIAEITWVLVIGAAVIFAGVMLLALFAVFGRRERTTRLSQRALIVGGGIVFPVSTLAVLLTYSLVRASALSVAGEGALRIEVTGEQWWWRVHYLDAAGNVDFATANEIRIPAGKPVDLVLRSADVIHSFWVPSLAGKLDMVPGHVNRMRIVAKAPGRFRGQCAEYCGGPHALMSFFVVATSDAEFSAWSARQRQPRPAATGEAARGQEIVEAQCAACHTVRGTRAAGTRGPDLTHLDSRLTVGAGLAPMNPGTVAAFIASSQKMKPGALMPSFTHFSGEDLRAVASYLGASR
jgi:cytochrome c oxidase subunit 2